MAEDDDTPVRSISSAALSIANIAGEDLFDHLSRSLKWKCPFCETEHVGLPVSKIPAGFLARLGRWIVQGSKTIIQEEREQKLILQRQVDRLEDENRRLLEENIKYADLQRKMP